MSNSYQMKMKAGRLRVRAVGAHSTVAHVLLVGANDEIDIFLLFVINEQGLCQSSQCLRLHIYLLTPSKP